MLPFEPGLFVNLLSPSTIAAYRRRRLHRIASQQHVLTPAEHLMTRLHAEQSGSMVVLSAAKIEGRLTPHLVEAICQRLQQRHPNLRASIQGHKSRLWFEVCETPPPLRIGWEVSCSSEAWAQAALQLGQEAFDRTQGPLFRGHVIQHPTANLCHVIFAGHHAICDGRSLTQLLSEFVQLAAGKSLPARNDVMRPLPQVPRTKGVWRPILKEIGWRLGQRRAFRKHPLVKPLATAKDQDQLCRRILTAEATTALLQQARQEQTTVLSVIVAALLTALWRHNRFDKQSIRFRIPLDIRPHCEPPVAEGACGCYATMLELTLINPGSLSFWDLARQTRRAIEQQLTAGTWQSQWHILRWVLRRGSHLGVQPTFCGISNLGVITFPDTPDYKIQEFSTTVTQRGLSNNLRLSCATVHGALNLTLRTPWHSPDAADQLLTETLNVLLAATGIPPATPSDPELIFEVESSDAIACLT